MLRVMVAPIVQALPESSLGRKENVQGTVFHDASFE